MCVYLIPQHSCSETQSVAVSINKWQVGKIWQWPLNKNKITVTWIASIELIVPNDIVALNFDSDGMAFNPIGNLPIKFRGLHPKNNCGSVQTLLALHSIQVIESMKTSFTVIKPQLGLMIDVNQRQHELRKAEAEGRLAHLRKSQRTTQKKVHPWQPEHQSSAFTGKTITFTREVQT